MVYDDNEKRYRVSSGAFSKGGSSCSIDLEQLIVEDGLAVTALFPGLPRAVALYAIPVGTLRSLGLSVEHEPVLANWYHGGICDGQARVDKKKRAILKAALPLVDIDQEAARRYHILPPTSVLG